MEKEIDLNTETKEVAEAKRLITEGKELKERYNKVIEENNQLIYAIWQQLSEIQRLFESSKY
jgi:hypothetical protein